MEVFLRYAWKLFFRFLGHYFDGKVRTMQFAKTAIDALLLMDNPGFSGFVQFKHLRRGKS